MNQTWKKTLLSLLCACLLLSAACSRPEEPQPEPPAPEQGEDLPPNPPEPEDNGVTVESDLSTGRQEEQGQPLLSWSISIPRPLLNGEPMMNIGNYYDNYKEKRLLALEEELLPEARQRLEEGLLPGAFEVEEDFAVARSQGNLLSIRRSCWQYTGGAHESLETKAETWLLREGDCYRLFLEDLLPGASNPRQLVLELALASAQRQAAEDPDFFYENYQEAMEQTWLEEDFYLTEDSLGLIFQQYAIAPYTSGVCTFEIPFSQLGDSLIEELRP